MKKLCALLTFTLALAMPAQAAQVKFGNASVHDPSVLYDGGTYYIYGSHMQAAKSVDLQDWKLFSKLDKCALRPDYALEFKEALTFAEAGTFWAPDVIRLADGRYYMYYCCCEGSRPLAALGVAVADSPEGPFENIPGAARPATTPRSCPTPSIPACSSTRTAGCGWSTAPIPAASSCWSWIRPPA